MRWTGFANWCSECRESIWLVFIGFMAMPGRSCFPLTALTTSIIILMPAALFKMKTYSSNNYLFPSKFPRSVQWSIYNLWIHRTHIDLVTQLWTSLHRKSINFCKYTKTTSAQVTCLQRDQWILLKVNFKTMNILTAKKFSSNVYPLLLAFSTTRLFAIQQKWIHNLGKSIFNFIVSSRGTNSVINRIF